jgi:single-stranded DNA-specific DHH superfamily exonuclease
MSTGFDTHSAVKTLTAAGMSEAQAEAVTELLKLSRDGDFGALATKADLQREITALRSDLQREIAELRSDLQREIAELRSDLQREIAESKADTLKWVFGMIAGAVVINIIAIFGAMLAAVRILGH